MISCAGMAIDKRCGKQDQAEQYRTLQTEEKSCAISAKSQQPLKKALTEDTVQLYMSGGSIKQMMFLRHVETNA